MSPDPVPPATQHAEAFGRGNVVVQIQGDGNTVIPGLAHLTLTRYLNRRRGGDGPSGEAAEILSPYALAIPFIGRETVMADLRTWMEKDQPISVRVLTARGGGGKTRLALELCDEATRKGWFAGFVTDRELQRFLAQQNLSTWRWNRPTLVVIDYAASRARLLHDWLVELADNAGDSGYPLRLLLLERFARPNTGWWPEAFGRGGGDALAVRRLLDPVDGPYVLPSLTAPERRVVFSATLERAGSTLRPPSTSDFDRRLAELSWGGEPLFLMLAGLTAARLGLGHVLTLSPTDVAFEVAEHELKRIREIGESRGLRPGFLSHMAAYVTLSQGVTRAQAEEAISVEKQKLRYDSGGDPPDIYEALAIALPGGDEEVSPILPDIVGEATILLALGIGDPQKAVETVSRAAKSLGDDRVTATVIRTTQDFGGVRKEALAWLSRLVQDQRRDREAIRRIVKQLPSRTVILGQIATELTADLVEQLRQGDDKILLARQLSSLARRMSALGRWEEALAAVQEAIEICRENIPAYPKVRKNLAGFLNTYANQLIFLKRWEEALIALEESVLIHREIVSKHPDASQAFLSTALGNLSIVLSALGRREEALMAIEEAVQIRRKETSTSMVSMASLAWTLQAMAHRLGTIGKYDEALQVGREAVDILRELTSVRAESFRPNLADALNSLGRLMRLAGQLEEAIEISREAVEISRILDAAHPGAFRRNLMDALKNLGILLARLDRLEEAILVEKDVVEISRKLASVYSGYRSGLAKSLDALSDRLSQRDRREDALAATREALDVYRQLAAERPDKYERYMAVALSKLAIRLGDLGEREAAWEASREAVYIYRKLVVGNQKSIRPHLAKSLDHLSIYLAKLGRYEEGLPVAREAIHLYRELVATQPKDFRRHLAKALNSLSFLLSELGYQEEALSVIQEAVEIWRELATARPDLLSELAASLNNLSNRLSEAEYWQEAVPPIEESVTIRRELSAKYPGTFRSRLALPLTTLAKRLKDVGRFEEALAAAGEAVEILRDLSRNYPKVFQPRLANSLHALSSCLKELGQRKEALDASRQAISLMLPFCVSSYPSFQKTLKEKIELYLALVQEDVSQPDRDLVEELMKLGIGLDKTKKEGEAR